MHFSSSLWLRYYGWLRSLLVIFSNECVDSKITKTKFDWIVASYAHRRVSFYHRCVWSLSLGILPQIMETGAYLSVTFVGLPSTHRYIASISISTRYSGFLAKSIIHWSSELLLATSNPWSAEHIFLHKNQRFPWSMKVQALSWNHKIMSKSATASSGPNVLWSRSLDPCP
jgi:hypothetical protein